MSDEFDYNAARQFLVEKSNRKKQHSFELYKKARKEVVPLVLQELELYVLFLQKLINDQY